MCVGENGWRLESDLTYITAFSFWAMELLQLRYWPDVWSRVWLILKEFIDKANS